MGQLGIGSMLHQLSGGSKHSSTEYVGKIIKSISMDGDHLYINFTDGIKIDIFDDGQSCCEYRYMRTDDDIQSIVGKTIVSILSKDAPNEPDGYGDHESCIRRSPH